jgi:GGDEF domain-containing protein
MTTDFQPTSQGPRAEAAALRPGAMPHGWISQTLRHLERWVAWSIAFYTAWLAAFVYPDVPALWFSVLYAGLVGKWAEAHPARSQAIMALRGVALIAGAWVLHTQIATHIGGPGGPFFFWLSITCLLYAFMLKPVWAAGLVTLAIVEFALASLLSGAPASAAELVPKAGFLCIFPLLLGMRFGAEMRRPDDALEGGRIDTATALYNKSGLTAYGNELLAQCNAARKPLSIVVFDCADLIEVRDIYSTAIARKLMARVVQKFIVLAADRGLAARTGPAEFTVVMPGLNRDKAVAAIQRVLGRPGRIEFDTGDDEIVIVPSFAIETSGPGVDSIDELYRELRETLTETDALEMRRQNYLQRERERHSRPMSIIAIADIRVPTVRRPIRVAPTMPAPLVIS